MACPQKTFYWYFKPIAMICKVMGVFPLQNVIACNDPKDLTVRIYSWANLYNVVIYAAIIYMIWFLSGFVFCLDRSMFLGIVVYVIIGRSTVCFLFCSTHFRMLPKMIRLLDSFDKRKTSLLTRQSGCGLKKLFMWTILPLIIGIVSFGGITKQTMNIVLETMPLTMNNEQMLTAAFFLSSLSIWQVLPLLVYIYFARRIVCNYNNISRALRECGFTGNFEEHVKYNTDDLHTTLEYLRYMHNMMTKTVYELGKCFGNFMAIDQLAIIVMVIANICIFIKEKNHEASLLLFTGFNVILVIAVLQTSHHIKEAGTKVVELTHGTVFSQLDKSVVQIQTLLMQLASYPVEVSAAGYFKIDKTQISSVSTAAIYNFIKNTKNIFFNSLTFTSYA